MSASPAHLDYLSQISRQLGVTDPVEEYYAPLVGKWSALRDEADRWRTAAKAAGEVTDTLTKSLGGLDASWQGKDADSFMAYMQSYGLSGHDLADAMTAMADALQQTADHVEHLVDQLGDVLADSADTVSDALSVPVHGEKRATEHLDDQREPTKQLFESVRDVLEAFTKLCGGDAFSKITVQHPMPSSNWSYDYAPPQAPAATVPAAAGTSTAAGTPTAAGTASAAGHSAPTDTAAAAAALAGGHAGGAGGAMPAAAGIGAAPTQAPSAGNVSGVAEQAAVEHPTPPPAAASAAPVSAAQGGAGSGMGMMGGMGGGQKGQGGEDTEHKSKIRLSGDLRDLLGTPEKTAPTVIGEK
ncbi:WXG100 family type VII secretion target [Kutzneria sp. CA-103260]|uniref:WXG100 family type VII secretion target n=1 Tax=Kutzneria sp. CA-103260 TaxID=2802641 RepID=UPI001BADA781|nr:WXG100 family type VII secretion target [Kutzneria sp. CA-103260]QUQ70669.1 hypothetical protein JJ691_84520 [Kutzneria sp. CA-103260]